MKSYFYSLAKDQKQGFIAGVVKIFLLLLSSIYRFILLLVRSVYSLNIIGSKKVNCKVISVGNITCGGTGKTPFVNMLARYLSDDKNAGKKEKIAILIRGYKRSVSSSQPRSLDYKTMGDEGYLLAKDLDIPVLVGRDRIKTAKEAKDRYRVSTIILDDAFQHWRLHRDLDIVLINTTNPFGNGWVIPRGILREPLSALKRADMFVLTKVDLAEDVEAIENKLKLFNPDALVVRTRHRAKYFINREGNNIALSEIKNREVCIFSALADPFSFENTVLNMRAKIKLKFEFDDHHHYCQKDIDKIIEQAKAQNIDTVITTEKDMVKLSSFSFAAVNLLVLKIELEIIKNEQEFYARLHRS